MSSQAFSHNVSAQAHQQQHYYAKTRRDIKREHACLRWKVKGMVHFNFFDCWGWRRRRRWGGWWRGRWWGRSRWGRRSCCFLQFLWKRLIMNATYNEFMNTCANHDVLRIWIFLHNLMTKRSKTYFSSFQHSNWLELPTCKSLLYLFPLDLDYQSNQKTRNRNKKATLRSHAKVGKLKYESEPNKQSDWHLLLLLHFSSASSFDEIFRFSKYLQNKNIIIRWWRARTRTSVSRDHGRILRVYSAPLLNATKTLWSCLHSITETEKAANLLSIQTHFL